MDCDSAKRQRTQKASKVDVVVIEDDLQAVMNRLDLEKTNDEYATRFGGKVASRRASVTMVELRDLINAAKGAMKANVPKEGVTICVYGAEVETPCSVAEDIFGTLTEAGLIRDGRFDIQQAIGELKGNGKHDAFVQWLADEVEK